MNCSRKISVLVTFFSIFFLFWIHRTVSSNELNLEQKVGQLLLVHFNGKELNDEARRLIDKAHVGGFIYYNWANGLDNPEQVRLLSRSLQDYVKQKSPSIPLFLVVDQEGGRVNRLNNGFTSFPSASEIGKTQQPQLAKAMASVIGQELLAVGINMNLAPVCDINTNPHNPVIGDRAFSSNPQEVSQFCEMALEGYQQVGMISALKHFPGHGDTIMDSHQTLPVLNHSTDYLNNVELVPFRNLASKADVIITAHLLVTALDPDHPVTFSREIIHNLLRERFHYHGVIMTDSLVMQGLMNCCPSIEEAAIRSFEAGHDIILLGGKQLLGTQNGFELDGDRILRIHKALVEAVKTGRISEERLNSSVERILYLKNKYSFSQIQQKNFLHFSSCIPPGDALKIGTQIWHNECKNQIEGLTSWNVGEEFASLGIGHFIWYPDETPAIFEQTFPHLLIFLKEQGILLPKWLEKAKGCPWKSRQSFLEAQQSTEMQELRQLLANNVQLQISFMIQRLQQAIPRLTSTLSFDQQKHVQLQINRLINTPQGAYILLDYLNFKGEGTSPKERYQGEGWGLLQVLLSMRENQQGVSSVEEFITCAKQVLTKRVQNAPLERNEHRWLKGWHHRLDSYRSFSITAAIE